MKALKDQIPHALVNYSYFCSYFFDRLAHPAWLRPLCEKGFFKAIPEPVLDSDRGEMRLSPWHPFRYLARMAGNEPQTVLNIALQTETANPYVHENVTDAALKLSPKSAARLIPKISNWLALPYQFQLGTKAGQLVCHLAAAGEKPAALILAEALLQIVPDPRADEKRGSDYASPEPQARLRDYLFGEVLTTYIPVLAEAAGLETLDLLCRALEKVLMLSRRDES